MKLSCVPVSYFPELISGEMSIGDWAREAAELGLDGIDLSILFFEDRSPARVRQVRDDIESAGVMAAVMNTYPDFTHPDKEVRARELTQLEKDIALSAAVGLEMVRVTAGQAHPETAREDGIAWAIEGLAASCVAAERLGVKLVFENHSKPGAWQYADFCFPPEIFIEIADGLADSTMEILYDTANPVAYGADPLPLLDRVIDRVACVHVADTAKKGALEPVVIGAGIVPVVEIFARLRRAGYDGWVSIEEASGTGAEGLAQAVTFVRNEWREAENEPEGRDG